MRTLNKKFNFRVSLLLILLAFFFYSCSDKEKADDKPKKSSEKKITEFSFKSTDNTALATAKLGDITGVVDESKKTIVFSITPPPQGVTTTTLKSLKASFEVSNKAAVKVGSTEQKSGETANDFSKEVKYTVTAEDGTTQEYTVTVTIDKEFVDSRDGKKYPIAKMGNQVWMLKNFEYVYEDGVKSIVAKAPKGNETFGRAYTQEGAREAAPTGWRLPTIAEWQALYKNYDKELMTGGNTGFNVVNGKFGSCSSSTSCNGGQMHFWTHAACRGIVITDKQISRPQHTSCRGYFFVVRYVKDDKKLPRTGNEILDFKVEKANNANLSDDVKAVSQSNILYLQFTANTNVSTLVPTFSISKAAKLEINGKAVESKQTSVQFEATNTAVVTAENGKKAAYEIKVIVGKSSHKRLTSFALASLSYQSYIGKVDNDKHTITFTSDQFPSGTDFVKGLFIAYEVSPKAKAQIGAQEIISSPGSTVDVSKPVTITVVAEDGSKQNYILRII